MRRSRNIEWVVSDWYKRAGYADCDLSTTLAKFFVKSSYAPLYLRGSLYFSMCRWASSYSKSQQRNVCRVCGRAHYVISRAGMTRLQLRYTAGQGMLRGVNRTGV